MVELREQRGKRLIKKDQPDRRPGHDDGQQRKNGAENTLSRMMPVCCRCIDPCITVMYQVKFPKQLYPVMQPMDQPGPDQVQYHQPSKRKKPQRQRKKIRQTDMMTAAMIGRKNDQRCKKEIDNDRGQ